MTGTGKSHSRKLLLNILVSAKTFSHCSGNFFCPGEEMGDISQGYTMLHVLQLNCQLSPWDRAVIGSVHIRFPSTPFEHKGWDVAKARKCTANHSWHEWQNKQKQMCLLTWLCEGHGSKVCFMFWQQQKKKMISEHRRLCRQRKVLSVIISEVAFADHKIPKVRKWLLWVPNPHNRPNKWQNHHVYVQGIQWNIVSIWDSKPRALHKSIRWSKFSTTLLHTVYAAVFLPDQREAM